MNKIINTLPLITALLLFIGYLNYTTYYRYFDIEITSYLTTGELLLSFLPLTFGVLFLLLIVIVVLIIAFIPMHKASEFHQKSENGISLWSIYLFWDCLKRIKSSFSDKERRNFRWLILLVLDFILCLLGIGIILFFVIFFYLMLPLIIENKLFPKWNYQSFFIFSLLWFFLLFDIIQKAEDSKRILFAPYTYLFFAVIAFVYFVAISNKMDATDLLKGKAKYKVEFEYEGATIKTDSNFLFIGKTSEYFFCRDLKAKVNMIYPVSEIKKIAISNVEQ